MEPLTRRQRPSTTQAKTGSRTNYQVSISQVCAFTAGIAIHNYCSLSHTFHKCVLLQRYKRLLCVLTLGT